MSFRHSQTVVCVVLPLCVQHHCCLRKYALWCVAVTQVDAGERWAKDLHERIGAAIRQARAGRRMSAQQVADKTADLGYPVSRSQIANFESGRKRTLDVAELMIVAAALDVPAVSLLFGGHPDRDVEVLPGQTTQTVAALARFIGDGSIDPNRFAAQWDWDSTNPPAVLLDLVRDRARAERELEDAKATFELLGEHDDDGRRIAHIRELSNRIASLNKLINVTTNEWSSDE